MVNLNTSSSEWPMYTSSSEWPMWLHVLILSTVSTLIVAFIVLLRSFDNSSTALNDRISKAMSGVVYIEGQKISMKGPAQGQTGRAVGSGFFIEENLIVTNYHVMDGVIDPTIVTYNNLKKYRVEVVSGDELADVVLVKIIDADWPAFKKEIYHNIFNLESSDLLTAGDVVISIGHPWGFPWSVSQGIISGLDRRMAASPAYYIQTDAKIYSGNSGGPLIDEQGRVVGMNTQIYINEGGSYGFSIPGELLKKVIVDLLDGDKKVTWPVMGIAFDVNEEGQIVLTSLNPEGGAAAAGIEVGDIVLSIEGQKIGKPDDFLNTLVIKNEKDIVSLEIKRGNLIKIIPVVLGGKLSEEYAMGMRK